MALPAKSTGVAARISVRASRQSFFCALPLKCRPDFCLTADLLRDTIYYVTRNSESDPTLLILASLAGGDKHGYAMTQDIERFSGARLGPGTLYGAITRLEALGWIRAVDAGDRRQPYTLTAAGRRHLREQLADLRRVVRAGLRRLESA